MKKILETNNYRIFVHGPFQREIGKLWRIEQSLLQYGWADDCPMTVTRLTLEQIQRLQQNGIRGAMFQIEDGHHRFMAAVKHGIPIKYVEMEKNKVLPQVVRDGTHRNHNLRDYMVMFAQNDYTAYQEVLKYHDRSGIGLNACISMMAGDSAGSGNWRKQFKVGTYRLGDPAHALLIESFVSLARKLEFFYWNSTPFVQALSKIAWAKVFDPEVLKGKFKTFPELLRKKGTRDEYILMIEAIYNHYNKEAVALAHEANVAAKKRNAIQKRIDAKVEKAVRRAGRHDGAKAVRRAGRPSLT
jgi:hypothetical protein